MKDAELIECLIYIIRNAQVEAQYEQAYETLRSLAIPLRVQTAIDERIRL